MDQQHIVTTIRSSVPLSKDQVVQITRILKGFGKSQESIKVVVDPSVIGGFTITSGDWFYDGSVKGQLQSLRNDLITK
jgi:F0F1-type ATP synthase delta subunit